MINKYSALAIFGFAVSSSFAQSYSNFEICKAAISSEMYVDVKIIRSLKSDENMPQIEYTRKFDGDKFKNQCMFEGDRVIWRAFFRAPYPTPGWGRWRNTDPNDSVIKYKVNNGVLEVSNSSTGEVLKFNKKDF